MRTIRIGSRKSPLAKAQVREVIDLLKTHHPTVEIEWVGIVTSGDRWKDRPLQDLGGKGLFVKEIESALLKGEIDLAVHSAKDLPSHLPEGLVVEVTPPRKSPLDILILPEGKSIEKVKKIGTVSLRRKVQFQERYPDVEIVPLRGNIDTRLRKLKGGEVDGIILAQAGYERLYNTLPPHSISLPWMIPAPNQGILAIETRKEVEILSLLKPIHDEKSYVAFTVERMIMEQVGGGCLLPFACYAFLKGEEITVLSRLWDEKGKLIGEIKVTGKRGREKELALEASERLKRGERSLGEFSLF